MGVALESRRPPLLKLVTRPIAGRAPSSHARAPRVASQASEMLNKSHTPAETEARLYEGWEASGAFAADPGSNAQPFTIMIPPPNVTGTLHTGHALTFTIQDTLIRWRRMQGRDVLWQPGTDHAGIATQMVVERLLADQGVTRQSLGREKFLERVWQSGRTLDTHVLEVYVGYLRQKLEAAGEPRLIHTMRGAGYVLRDD